MAIVVEKDHRSRPVEGKVHKLCVSFILLSDIEKRVRAGAEGDFEKHESEQYPFLTSHVFGRPGQPGVRIVDQCCNRPVRLARRENASHTLSPTLLSSAPEIRLDTYRERGHSWRRTTFETPCLCSSIEVIRRVRRNDFKAKHRYFVLHCSQLIYSRRYAVVILAT